MNQLMRRLFAPLLIVLLLCGAASAQTSRPLDINAWDALTKQAATAIQTDSTSEATFADLRSRIVSFRTAFENITGQNATEIATLREQIAALGEPPSDENAAPESADVAATRADLNRELSALLAPIQTAQASYLAADGLVRQIDQILRTRQADMLFEVGSSPLNPVFWPQAVSDLRNGFKGLWQSEAGETNESSWQILLPKLPVTILSGALGFILLLRGRKWAGDLVTRLRRFGANGAGIWSFLVSLLRILLPLAGIVALSFSAVYSGVIGPKGEQLLKTLPSLGAFLLGFRWVADRVFAREEDDAHLLNTTEDRAQARFYVGVMVVMISIAVILTQILEMSATNSTSRSIVGFPLALIICFAVYRIGRLLRAYHAVVDIEGETDKPKLTSLCRAARGIGFVAIAVALITPILMAAGYKNAGEAILQPFTESLGLLGLVMVLQRFATDLYGFVSKQGAAARDSLVAVAVGMLLLTLMLPILALAWGARVTDLTELWAIFNRGFAVGESRVSPSDFLAVVVIFSVGYMLTRLIQNLLRSNVLPKTKIDIGGQNAIISGLGYVGIFLAALAAITGAGIDLSSLAIVAGALSVGIGFGLQNIVSNFVSGIILLIERPISEGDWIEVGGKMGYVRDISVRSTRIETFDKTDVIVPNADLVSGTVTNYTRGNTVGRVIVPVGVAYGTDTRKVEAVLKEIAEAQPMVLAVPAPSIYFVNFGADALEFEVRCYLRDVNFTMSVKNDINHAIAARFAEEGFEIPFAQRDLWLRNPETLQQAEAVDIEGQA